jgi:acetyl-CoA acetyltransferase
MRNVYLTASVRTPIGRFGGSLASWSAADLGVAAAKASIERAGLRPDQIQQSHKMADFMEPKVCAVCVQVAEQYGIRPTSAHVNGIGKPALKPR